jgi:hypothetical protein
MADSTVSSCCSFPAAPLSRHMGSGNLLAGCMKFRRVVNDTHDKANRAAFHFLRGSSGGGGLLASFS